MQKAFEVDMMNRYIIYDITDITRDIENIQISTDYQQIITRYHQVSSGINSQHRGIQEDLKRLPGIA